MFFASFLAARPASISLSEGLNLDVSLRARCAARAIRLLASSDKLSCAHLRAARALLFVIPL